MAKIRASREFAQDFEVVTVNPFDYENDASNVNTKAVKPFKCEICSQSFTQKQTLRQHILTHTGVRPYQCNVCGKLFTQAGSLDRHVKLHYEGDKPFPCHLCTLSFRQLNNLNRHLKLHECNEPKFRCDICLRGFARKDGLLRHAKIHLSKSEKLYCQYCNKSFADEESLARHVKWHIDGIISETLTCSKCNAKIWIKELPNPDAPCQNLCYQCLHPETSSRNVSFVCERCDFTTSSLILYRQHHCITQDLPCNVKLPAADTLHDHIDSDHGENPPKYNCKLCPKFFRCKSRLYKHYLIHRHEVPDINLYVRLYQCHYCDQLFTCRTRIVSHTKKHDSKIISQPRSSDDSHKRVSNSEDIKKEIGPRESSFERSQILKTIIDESVSGANNTKCKPTRLPKELVNLLMSHQSKLEKSSSRAQDPSKSPSPLPIVVNLLPIPRSDSENNAKRKENDMDTINIKIDPDDIEVNDVKIHRGDLDVFIEAMYNEDIKSESVPGAINTECKPSRLPKELVNLLMSHQSNLKKSSSRAQDPSKSPSPLPKVVNLLPIPLSDSENNAKRKENDMDTINIKIDPDDIEVNNAKIHQGDLDVFIEAMCNENIKSPTVLSKELENLMLSRQNSEKTCVKIEQSNENVLIGEDYDGYGSEITSEVLLESPSLTENGDHINIIYDDDEPVAIFYNDEEPYVIKKEPLDENRMESKFNNQKEKDETSEDVFMEETQSALGHKEETGNEDFDVSEEFYSESLVRLGNSGSEDSMEIEYADQAKIDGIHQEIKNDQELDNQDDYCESEMVETASFLLEERTTSAPNSPRDIDDCDISEAFDSEHTMEVKHVDKCPDTNNQKISLESLKSIVRKPLESRVARNKTTQSYTEDKPGLPQGPSLVLPTKKVAASPVVLNKQKASNFEYVEVILAEEEQDEVELDVDEEIYFDEDDQIDRDGRKDFFCYICKKTYSSKSSLKRHFRVTHTNHEKAVCRVCSKTFQTRDAMKKHMKALHAPHRFRCDVCEKTFNRKDALASHQRLHAGDKPFACGTCGERFAQKQNLHAHSMKHRKEKPFTCDICDKGFCAKSTLTRHKLTHTGERHFTCEVCEKSFIQKGHLQNHYAVHDLVEKYFECSVCKKVFHRKETMLRHQQTHVRISFCDGCKMRLRTKADLRNHILKNACDRTFQF